MRRQPGVTLVELLIVVLILGALAAIAIPRIGASSTTAKSNACATNVDILNSQIELYHANTGSYPADLATLTSDTEYFPEGAPTCPLGGTYSYSDTTYRVTCNH